MKNKIKILLFIFISPNNFKDNHKYIANPNIKSYKSLSRIFNIDKKNNL